LTLPDALENQFPIGETTRQEQPACRLNSFLKHTPSKGSIIPQLLRTPLSTQSRRIENGDVE
jgi:hypothetical protein